MKTLLLFAFLFILPLSVLAQVTDLERQKVSNLGKNNIALKAYDPVSYFTEKEPLKGDKDIYSDYKGIRYHFATTANKATFDTSPDKYEPAYGGWCAYAVGKGYTADANPKTYKIIDDKLYVFYNNGLVNTLKRWNKDEAKLYPSSIENWPGLVADFLGK